MSARHRQPTPRRTRLVLAAAIAAVGLVVASPFVAGAAPSGSGVTNLEIAALCKQQLAARGLSSANRNWLNNCASAMAATLPTTASASPTSSATATATPTVTTQPPTTPPTSPSPTPTTPSPTATTPSPSPSTTAPTPSPSPTAAPSPTPTPTITGPVVGCPAYPAMPDGSCTGWQHTNVTLHACSLPLTQATYDSCDFPAGEVNVSAANITVTRSRFHGAVQYRTTDGGSLRGLTLIDVEIDSSSTLGESSIGNNDWTCIRCNIHGGTRGANPGFNVVLRDSWLHGWTSRTGDHITGTGSNGGGTNVIDHNRISCDITNDPTGYACSAGMSVYGDDAPGNDNWTITNNLFNSGSSYCLDIIGPPGKPYPFTNMTVTGNVFGADGAIARGLPPDECTEYGPIATQPGSWGVDGAPAVNGNVWADNHALSGRLVDPS